MSNLPVPEPAAELPLEALDIQHDTDPADDHGPVRRIPHLGHALLFFSLAFLLLQIATVLCFYLLHIPLLSYALHPGISLLGQGFGYLLTLFVSFQLFPRLWQRSFLHGIQWNVLAAHRRWVWVVPAAIVLSLLAQYADRFVKQPDNDLIGHIMQTIHGAWLVTIFGVLVAPVTEEIAFRGFLLPALATAYDWLALERSPASLRKWEMSSMHTTGAVVFAAVFSSIPFALIHAGQLSHAWGAVGILFVMSLALSFVRIRTHSVACSTLMHATYNLTVFAAAFIQTGGYRHLEKL